MAALYPNYATAMSNLQSMKSLWCLVLLALAGSLLSAQTNDCSSLTHQALEISGANGSMDGASTFASSDDFLAQFAKSDAKKAEFASAVKEIVRKRLNGDFLRNELEARMASRCKADEMSGAIQEMQSPLVARMLVLEAAARTPEGHEKMIKYAKVISIAPPPDSRVDAINAIDTNAGITDFNVDTVITITRGMMEGAEMSEDLVAEVEHHRREMTDQIRNPTQILLLATYRTASVPDLVAYANEAKAQPLKGFNDNIKKILLEILEEQAILIGRDLKAVTTAQASSPGKNP